MTSQRVERTRIRTGGYGRFRGEWVKVGFLKKKFQYIGWCAYVKVRQPLPQGAFTWLWRLQSQGKAPWDEVEIRLLS